MFEREFGPITPHERIDVAAAIVASAIVNAHGGNAEPSDFLPTWDEPVGDTVTWLRAMAGGK